MKLISMTDFVLYQNENFKSDRFYQGQFKDNVVNYANFLKQPLKLEMFVPCDEDGYILTYPDFFDGSYDDNGFGDVDTYQYKKDSKEYQQAKEKVLFEGFELKEELEFVCKFIYKGKEFNVLKHELPIEWLVGDEVELTPNAIKQIGL